MAKKIQKIHRDVSLENLKGFAKSASETTDDIFMSTGHFALDLAIAHGIHPDKVDLDTIPDFDINNAGGLPLGRLVEIYGTEGSGKSSIAYRICGYAQKLGYNCFWIDAENSFSRDLAIINGVDLKSLFLSNLENMEDPDKIYSAEEIMENICTACKNGFQIIVLDSVAALTTKAELENKLDEGGVGMGVLAQTMSKSVKKVCNYAAKYGVLVIMINQLREKIGSYGNPETTPGGKALKYHASVRLRFQRQMSKEGKVIKEEEDGTESVVAGKSYVRIEKNRCGKPVEDSIMVPIYYENYFPDIEDVAFNEGRRLNVIRIRMGTFSWDNVKEVGRKAFIDKIKADNLVDKLIIDLRNAAKEKESLLPPELLVYETKVEKKKDVKDGKDGEEKQVSRPRKRKDSTDSSDDSLG